MLSTYRNTNHGVQGPELSKRVPMKRRPQAEIRRQRFEEPLGLPTARHQIVLLSRIGDNIVDLSKIGVWVVYDLVAIINQRRELSAAPQQLRNDRATRRTHQRHVHLADPPDAASLSGPEVCSISQGST